MNCTEKISYDSEFDVLYYTFGDPSNSYGDEITNNIVILRDMTNEEPQGYTFLNFKKICQNKNSEYEKICQLISIEQILKTISENKLTQIG